MTDAFEARPLPHNISAEKALLGAILLNNRAYEAVADFLGAQHFAVGVHHDIYSVMAKMIGAGQLVDNVTMQRYFEQDETLADIGGPAYLADLLGSAVTVINAGEYGRILYDLHRRRELINLAKHVHDQAFNDEASADALIDEAEATLHQIAEGTDERVEADALGAALDGIEKAYQGKDPPGLSTGMIDLDNLFGRLRPQGLYVIAGATSMGKSVLAQNIAERVADEMPVAFFSLEMSGEEIQARRLCAKSRIDFTRLRDGRIATVEMDQVVEARNDIRDKPLMVDDRGGVTIPYIRRRAQRMKRKNGLGLIVVDYLQLVRASDVARKAGRVQEISEITRDLKALAKELDVPVVALSQLSRAVDTRDDKVPRLSDLRESGSIEQDADVVLFVFREHYYLERHKPAQRENEKTEAFGKRVDAYHIRLAKTEGLAELMIAKNRQGAIGSVTVSFHGEMMQFGNASHQEDMQI